MLFRSQTNKKESTVSKVYINLFGELPQSIRQIKGKNNLKPKKNYLPYVHDFIRSNKWEHIGDAFNTDLVRVKGNEIPGFEEWMKVKAHGNVPSIPDGIYTKDELLNFGKETGLHESHPSVFSKWQEKIGRAHV